MLVGCENKICCSCQIVQTHCEDHASTLRDDHFLSFSNVVLHIFMYIIYYIICLLCRKEQRNLPPLQASKPPTVGLPKKATMSKLFFRLFEVDENRKKAENIGKLFICCSRDCRFFTWSKVLPNIRILLQNEGYSSGVKDERGSRCICMGKCSSIPPTNELLSMLEHCGGIIEQKDIEITFYNHAQGKNERSRRIWNKSEVNLFFPCA